MQSDASRSGDCASGVGGVLFKRTTDEITRAEARMLVNAAADDVDALQQVETGTPVFVLDTDRAQLRTGFEAASRMRSDTSTSSESAATDSSLGNGPQLRIRRAGRVRALPWRAAAAAMGDAMPLHAALEHASRCVLLETEAALRLARLRAPTANGWPSLAESEGERTEAAAPASAAAIMQQLKSGSERSVLSTSSSETSGSGSPASSGAAATGMRPRLSMVALATDSAVDDDNGEGDDDRSSVVSVEEREGDEEENGAEENGAGQHTGLQKRSNAANGRPPPLQTDDFSSSPGCALPAHANLPEPTPLTLALPNDQEQQLLQRTALNAAVDGFLDAVARAMNVRPLQRMPAGAFGSNREMDLSAYSGNGANLVWNRVQEVVANMYGSAAVQIYGSFATGLWLPGQSDLDLLVSFQRYCYPRSGDTEDDGSSSRSQSGGQTTSQAHQAPTMAAADSAPGSGAPGMHSRMPPQQPPHITPTLLPAPRAVDVVDIDRKQVLAYLCALHAALRSQPWCRSIKLIKNTSMPVIKLVAANPLAASSDEEIPVDISFRTRDHHGLEARDFVLQATEDLAGVLRPLVLVLKRLLRGMGLHDVYTGGLGSYSLTVLVTFFLLRVGFVLSPAPRRVGDAPASAGAAPSPLSNSSSNSAASGGVARPSRFGRALHRRQGSRQALARMADPDNVPPLLSELHSDDPVMSAAAAAVERAAAKPRAWLQAYVRGRAPEGADVGLLLCGFLEMLSPPSAGGLDLEAVEMSLDNRGKLDPRRPRSSSGSSAGSIADSGLETPPSADKSAPTAAAAVAGASAAAAAAAAAPLRTGTPPPARLCFRDPVKPTHRLGAGSFKMYLVQERFHELRQRLQKEPEALAALLAMPEPVTGRAAFSGPPAPPPFGMAGMHAVHYGMHGPSGYMPPTPMPQQMPPLPPNQQQPPLAMPHMAPFMGAPGMVPPHLQQQQQAFVQGRGPQTPPHGPPYQMPWMPSLAYGSYSHPQLFAQQQPQQQQQQQYAGMPVSQGPPPLPPQRSASPVMERQQASPAPPTPSQQQRQQDEHLQPQLQQRQPEQSDSGSEGETTLPSMPASASSASLMSGPSTVSASTQTQPRSEALASSSTSCGERPFAEPLSGPHHRQQQRRHRQQFVPGPPSPGPAVAQVPHTRSHSHGLPLSSLSGSPFGTAPPASYSAGFHHTSHVNQHQHQQGSPSSHARSLSFGAGPGSNASGREVRSLPGTPRRPNHAQRRSLPSALERIHVPSEGFTVVARNIPYEVTAEDVDELTRAFAAFGPVRAVSSSLTRGSLYVTYVEAKDAMAAMEALQFHPVRDRQLKIRWLDDLVKEKVLPPPVSLAQQ